MSEVLLVERSDRIAIVTLNRPEAMNALSRALRAALSDTMAELDRDDAIRVVIVTGAGTRAFTAGLDLKELGSDPLALSAANATALAENAAAAIAQCRKPVIGAINGAAITGGFELAIACDVLIASENARFADTHARVGIMPGWGLSQKLSRIIGLSRAREMSFTGNFIDAQTACSWGLVNRVVAAQALMATSMQLAKDMASVEPDMLVAYKKLITDGFALSLVDGLALEHRVSSSMNAQQTPEGVEARRAGVQARGRTQ